jgi:DNA-binding NtrC family response regulator
MDILFSWVGMGDIRAYQGERGVGLGPVAQALSERRFDLAILLSDHGERDTEGYQSWLKQHTATEVMVEHYQLTGPTNMGEIWQAAIKSVDQVAETWSGVRRFYHTTPGTPVMGAVWLLLHTIRPATLIETMKDHGTHTLRVPFDITAEFLPYVNPKPTETARRISQGIVPEGAGWETIVYECDAMHEAVAMAQRVAVRNLPVLIEGESGTGKELIARAIHNSSPAAKGRFVAVNCGAIPKDLVAAELFGHKRGTFTNALADRLGHFREADGGTLFLDEIGELPPEVQVALLRPLQNHEVLPVGESRPVPVNVRLVAATHRALVDELAAGRFREDLFYRIAVAMIRVPPLRERVGDHMKLAEHLLAAINDGSRNEPGWVPKRLSAKAKNVILTHDWPGNVRELQNTLYRAAVWSEGEVISDAHLRSALVERKAPRHAHGAALPRGTALPDYLDGISRDAIAQALAAEHGSKTRAARRLGFKNHQTLSNWMERLGLA